MRFFLSCNIPGVSPNLRDAMRTIADPTLLTAPRTSSGAPTVQHQQHSTTVNGTARQHNSEQLSAAHTNAACSARRCNNHQYNHTQCYANSNASSSSTHVCNARRRADGHVLQSARLDYNVLSLTVFPFHSIFVKLSKVTPETLCNLPIDTERILWYTIISKRQEGKNSYTSRLLQHVQGLFQLLALVPKHQLFL